MFEDIVRSIVEDVLENRIPDMVEEAVKRQMKPAMLTTSQVEEQYGIDRQKQYRLRQNGTLTYVQDGRTITYPTETIDQYVKDHMISGKY